MLSQGVMDELGTQAAALYGALMESLTYRARRTPTAIPVLHTVQGMLKAYRAHDIDALTILRTDLECRIQTRLVVWVPTQYDDFDRSDGTTWSVQAVAGGPGHPWYRLHVRQVA